MKSSFQLMTVLCHLINWKLFSKFNFVSIILIISSREQNDQNGKKTYIWVTVPEVELQVKPYQGDVPLHAVLALMLLHGMFGDVNVVKTGQFCANEINTSCSWTVWLSTIKMRAVNMTNIQAIITENAIRVKTGGPRSTMTKINAIKIQGPSVFNNNNI